MSSMIRRLQRRIERSRPDYEPKPQHTIVYSDGSYSTNTGSKWVFMSAARLNAQRIIASIFDRPRLPTRKKPAKVWRKPHPAVPNTITRQQIRYARRKGFPIPTVVA